MTALARPLATVTGRRTSSNSRPESSGSSSKKRRKLDGGGDSDVEFIGSNQAECPMMCGFRGTAEEVNQHASNCNGPGHGSTTAAGSGDGTLNGFFGAKHHARFSSLRLDLAFF